MINGPMQQVRGCTTYPISIAKLSGLQRAVISPTKKQTSIPANQKW
jgi:hypothetical protein